MMTLYNIPVSGNCHKIRLLLSFLKLDYKTYNLDLSVTEQKSVEYTQLNPFGQAPVLDDSGIVIRDSQAILVYLAKTYGGTDWWPDDPIQLAHIIEWLSTAANEITHGPAALRAHLKFDRVIDNQQATNTTNKVLKIINNQLESRTWLTNHRVSIADIAIYPYLALAHEGGVELAPYPFIERWKKQFEALPHFITMPGIRLSTI